MTAKRLPRSKISESAFQKAINARRPAAMDPVTRLPGVAAPRGALAKKI